MISDERLEDLIIWVDSKDGDGREYPDDAVAALQELLDARQKIDKLVANSERLAEFATHKKASCFLMDVPMVTPEEEPQFCNCGYCKVMIQHADLMREIKVQDAIDKTLSENTEAWRKLADD